MSVVPFGAPRRLSGDRGAALVEAAFITPLFLYLILALMEFGLLFRGWLSVGSATQDGARTASVLGFQQDADYQVIQVVKKSLTLIPQSNITRLVVFKGLSSAASSVPTSCKTATTRYQDPGNFCNTYTPGMDWAQPVTNSPFYNCAVPGWSAGYCTSTRKTSLIGAGPDYIGIYIELTHPYVTKLFGTTKSVSSQTITRLEPTSIA